MRFEEERDLLKPLAARSYQPLVLSPIAGPVQQKRRIISMIAAERRPLTAYTALVAGAA